MTRVQRQNVSRLIVILGLLLCARTLRGDDAYFTVPRDQLKIISGDLPQARPDGSFVIDRAHPEIGPYAVLDGEGEIYLRSAPGAETGFDQICIRVPKLREVTGTIYARKLGGLGFSKLRFVVPASASGSEQRITFLETKKAHYAWLASRQIPGGAWFRFQGRQATAEINAENQSTAKAKPAGLANPSDHFKDASPAAALPAPVVPPAQPTGTAELPAEIADDSWDETFAVFSGGRAVAENLQLGRLLRITSEIKPTVDLASIQGITTQTLDWGPLVKQIHPKLDPLAAAIPADQHAIFCPSLESMLRLMDEANSIGVSALGLAQNARTRERYEQQLCLPLDPLTRAVGNAAIKGLAVTGSDPYLPTGTDLAILLDASNPGVLVAHLKSQQTAARQKHAKCTTVAGALGKVQYTGVITPDRAICSYVAEVGGAVVVTNSLVQLQRIADATAGRTPALASLPEYRFFRNRYPIGSGESGLLILSDSAIRRWCSPKWRIASSRRTRAAAVMSHFQAEFLKELMAGTVKPHEIHATYDVPDMGTLRVTADGVESATYGNLEFLTPIAELNFTKVSTLERDGYQAWRNSYQSNWKNYFDPIAVCFTVQDKRLAADLTVMPLIAGTEYRDYLEIVSGVQLKPTAGDPHAGSLIHFAMAVNPNSATVKSTASLLPGSLQASPFGWLGDSISVYVDDDPFWNEFADVAKKNRATSADAYPGMDFLMANLHRVPVAVTAEVQDPLKLALFLTGLRNLIEQTAPGMVTWTTNKYHDQTYVKLAASVAGIAPGAGKLEINYAATPRRLIVTPNEALLKRVLDRLAASNEKVGPASAAKSGPAAKQKPERTSSPAGGTPRSWLGSSIGLSLNRRAIELLALTFVGHEYQSTMQESAWSNLPILNEWKRLYPDRDPVAVHQQIWKTQLTSPNGGNYVWNKEFQTMESTVYGCPGQPRLGPLLPRPLQAVESLDFGLSFENQGLRARGEIHRKSGN